MAAAKKNPCEALNEWIKSIIHHLWWAVSTCNGDKTLLIEKCCSILFQIQNKHKWPRCSKFHNCVHPRITKSKARKKLRLKPTSDAFKALQSIVLDKHILRDLKYLTTFSHTGILEIFHALYNNWIPKKSTLSSFRNGHKKPVSRNGFQLCRKQKAKAGQDKGKSWLFENNKTVVK